MPNNLASVLLEGVPQLFSAASAGDAHSAAVAVRRLLGRLRQVDPALADELKSRLPAGGGDALRTAAATATVAPRDSDSNLGLLRRIQTEDVLRPVMRPDTDRAFNNFLLEHRNVEALAQQGLTPRSTMLLVGPPGVGKTMASAWIASELGLPLYQIELSGLMSSYLGKTGQNLREVFDFARMNSCVLLMDEFDSVGKRRDDPGDLGEVRRIVSVLLKEIEEWPGPSILLAATNFDASLDRAVVRRFQTVVQIDPPGADEAANMLSMHLAGALPSAAVMKLAGELLAGKSGSDIRNVAVESRRFLALQQDSTVDRAILRALAARATSTATRRRFAQTARNAMTDASFAVLAELLGVSKGTIHTYLSVGERSK